MASTCSGSGRGTNTTPETEESATPPPLFFNSDHKWRLSKKEGSPSRRSSSIKNSSSTQRRCAFATKCATLFKQQRARFYIMRRCVIMLICWNEYNDS